MYILLGYMYIVNYPHAHIPASSVGLARDVFSADFQTDHALKEDMQGYNVLKCPHDPRINPGESEGVAQKAYDWQRRHK